MRHTLILILMLTGLIAQAQTYTIVHSIGKIYDTNSEKYLVRGMRINASAELQFQSEGARAAVLSSQRGRFVIQEQSGASSKSEISYALASVLSPARGKLSTRAGGINNKLDFEKRFGEGPVAILGNTYKVAVSSTAFPMNDDKFFYANYQYGGEAINKRLASQGDSLIIDVVSFYSVDGKSIDPMETSDVKLFYYDAGSEESTFVTNLEFAVVSDEELKSMVGHMSDVHVSERNTAVLEIINGVIGKCSEKDLESALSKF